MFTIFIIRKKKTMSCNFEISSTERTFWFVYGSISFASIDSCQWLFYVQRSQSFRPGLYAKLWNRLQVESIKSIQQYFRFFGKELSISRFKNWDWFQMKVLIILHSIGVFATTLFNMEVCLKVKLTKLKLWGLWKLCGKPIYVVNLFHPQPFCCTNSWRQAKRRNKCE